MRISCGLTGRSALIRNRRHNEKDLCRSAFTFRDLDRSIAVFSDFSAKPRQKLPHDRPPLGTTRYHRDVASERKFVLWTKRRDEQTLTKMPHVVRTASHSDTAAVDGRLRDLIKMRK